MPILASRFLKFPSVGDFKIFGIIGIVYIRQISHFPRAKTGNKGQVSQDEKCEKSSFTNECFQGSKALQKLPSASLYVSVSLRWRKYR
jgi:hypothetical protein